MDKFMKLAFELAKKSNPLPNPRVGAVLVKNNKILGRGYHKKAGMPHAEIEAIEDAKRKGNGNLKGSTIYVTLEPCSHKNKRTPPCTQAILSNGINKVVFAMRDPNPLVTGERLLREAGVKVVGPVAEQRVRSLNAAYLQNLLRKPLVAIKMAMSADGKTATRTGDSKWITGKEARKYVHKLRSEFDAVVVGAGTVKKDNPRLTARLKGARNPYRIIVDGDLCIPLDSNILKHKDGKTIIAATEKAPKSKISEIKNKTNSQVLVCGAKSVDMRKLILSLSAMGMKKIMLEGGSELNARALEAGIVDKLYLFVAPKIIGGRDAKGVIGGLGIESISSAVKLKNMKTKRFGQDILLEFNLQK